jgi:CarD family transcriptional regulator
MMGPADPGDVEGVVALALLVVITGLPLGWLAGLAVAGLEGKHLVVAVGLIGIRSGRSSGSRPCGRPSSPASPAVRVSRGAPGPRRPRLRPCRALPWGVLRDVSRLDPKGGAMSYAQGDTVVHPQHGAATVGETFTKDLGQGPTEYVELYVEFSSMKILVPAESVKEVGLRSLSSRKDAAAILALLEEDVDVPLEWTERNAINQARMRSLELDQLAMVVRDLLAHQRRIDKPLNLGEKAALDKCLGLLARELSLTLGLTEDETLALLAAHGAGDAAGSDAEAC